MSPPLWLTRGVLTGFGIGAIVMGQGTEAAVFLTGACVVEAVSAAAAWIVEETRRG